MNALRILFRYTLNNVILGITLMVLIALYIAVGSGIPSVREFFEVNELEFFDAWPLKLMMLLLCVNLAVVTWNRIPLTPPRYGVWCIHAGIIVLITGTSLYYHLKVEGKTLIPLNHTVNVFYDSAERALYARTLKGEMYGMHPLPSLPRFGSYDSDHDPDRLRRGDLTDISTLIPVGLQPDAPNQLSRWLSLDKPVTLDVVGFYSYADVVEDISDDPDSAETGVEIKVTGPRPQDQSSLMLRATDPTASHQVLGSAELEYRQVSDSSLAEIRDSAGRLFELASSLGSESPGKLDMGIGKTVEIEGGKYSITIESYNPAFPLFGTHDVVQAMTIHVVRKSGSGPGEFWRMILAGRDLQTDFKMDPATTPPFVKGNRQKEPIDKDLVLGFRVTDAAALLPTGGDDKHILLTSGARTLVDIHTSFSAPAQITDMSNGGEIDAQIDGSPVTAEVHRRDHFTVLTHVVQTLPENRTKDEAESGSRQVAVVRVSYGDWSRDVAIPCDLYAAPDPMVLEPMIPWSMGVVQIPGASAALQLQLGYTCRAMPAALTLKKFDMVPYAGGQLGGGLFRDFRSTLEVSDSSGQTNTQVASLNNPIYFDHGSWIFFQAGYDPDGHSSTIGVGNRPGVNVMLSGCVMIVLGVMYTFYVKPVVIRRMKAAAIARAAGKRELLVTKAM